jgi:hypothetical protein
MSARLAAGAALLAAACTSGMAALDKSDPPIASKPGPHPAAELRGLVTIGNGGFEERLRPGEACPERWSCSAHGDPTSYSFRPETVDGSEGKIALCVYRLKPEPWSLLTQSLDATAMRGARLRLSVAVRIDPDSAFGVTAGPWALVYGPQGNLDFVEKPVDATRGWERITIEVPVAANARSVEVGATMLGGGRACFDDVRLEILR